MNSKYLPVHEGKLETAYLPTQYFQMKSVLNFNKKSQNENSNKHIFKNRFKLKQKSQNEEANMPNSISEYEIIREIILAHEVS